MTVAAQTPLPRRTVVTGAAAGVGSTLPATSLATGTASTASAGSAWPAGIRPRGCRAADQPRREASPRFLVAHCRRSLRLATLIATARHAGIDAEVVDAGVMLHHLDRTARHHSPGRALEVASATAVRALARRHDLAAQPAQKARDVVAACRGPAGSPTPTARRPRWAPKPSAPT
jgi:hypothetical protein